MSFSGRPFGRGRKLFSKAWGTGIGAVGFKDIEILNNDKGAPVVTQSPFEGNVFNLHFS